ncbi:hypothetical protein M378DRAFT_85403, partial [Amanita muscaria Koide BX008]
KRKRGELEVIVEQQPPAVQADLLASEVDSSLEWMVQGKRRRIDERNESDQESEPQVLLTGSHTLEEDHFEEFLSVPSAEELRQIQEQFLSRTSQRAPEEAVCGVCARETGKGDLAQYYVEELPNVSLLKPRKAHRTHVLHNGYLLESAGLFHMHPRIGQVSDPSSLQRGMIGNVTSFPLNLRDIVQMVEGRKLPQSVGVLPALIAITFIGTSQFPKQWLKGVLRVRREKVAAALKWLLANNVLYQQQSLDTERLALLPEDDVPIELQAIVRHESDVSVLVEEADSYVPGDIELRRWRYNFSHQGVDLELGSIQLVHLGTTDDSIVTQTDGEALISAVANLCKEGVYDIRPGRTFVRDLPERGEEGDKVFNYSASAFPNLFPYGIGGVESCSSLGFTEHIRYCLLYHDHQFRKHHSFSFVMFGLFQKRQVLASARLQMRRRDFERVSRDILQVTEEDLRAAAGEKERGMTISDDKVKTLLNSVKLTSGRIVGTDQLRAALRSKIWSTVLIMGPPSIWMTINLADIHDPIAQLFCREEIDLDHFNDLQGRCANNIIRAQNIAQDPYAAAKYFHVMISIILEALFGISTSGKRTYCRKGLLGCISAYTGTVESQNRASLHLHILLWLVGAPQAGEMRDKFQSAEFRTMVSKFVAANIHAGAPGLTQATLAYIPRESDLSFARPPRPSTPAFEEQFQNHLLRLARNLQVHVCVRGACKHFIEEKEPPSAQQCAPWPESDVVTVNPDGTWNPVCAFGMVNNFHPQILVFIQCNGDIKLLTNGAETKSITWYITKYATKAQKRLFNASALLAKSLAFHFQDNKNLDDARARSCLLLFRCFQGLNRQQEQSAPQVISYLMGWDDCFLSHEFAPIYISALQFYLRRQVHRTLELSE